MSELCTLESLRTTTGCKNVFFGTLCDLVACQSTGQCARPATVNFLLNPWEAVRLWTSHNFDQNFIDNTDSIPYDLPYGCLLNTAIRDLFIQNSTRAYVSMDPRFQALFAS